MEFKVGDRVIGCRHEPDSDPHDICWIPCMSMFKGNVIRIDELDDGGISVCVDGADADASWNFDPSWLTLDDSEHKCRTVPDDEHNVIEKPLLSDCALLLSLLVSDLSNVKRLKAARALLDSILEDK